MIGVWGGVAMCMAVVALLGWNLLRPAERFMLRIEGGRVTLVRGHVNEAFITDAHRICQLWGITEGTIRGIGIGQRVRIEVDGGIPAEHTRAFQNAWDHPL